MKGATGEGKWRAEIPVSSLFSRSLSGDWTNKQLIVVLKVKHFPVAQKYSGSSRLGWLLSPSSSAAAEEKEGARESLHAPPQL